MKELIIKEDVLKEILRFSIEEGSSVVCQQLYCDVNNMPNVLDKIRAEIAEFEEEVFHRTEDYSDYAAVRYCLEIIDKYMAESEGE